MTPSFISISNVAQATRRVHLALGAPVDHLTERVRFIAGLLDTAEILNASTGDSTHDLARTEIVAIETERHLLKIVFAQAGPYFS